MRIQNNLPNVGGNMREFDKRSKVPVVAICILQDAEDEFVRKAFRCEAWHTYAKTGGGDVCLMRGCKCRYERK